MLGRALSATFLASWTIAATAPCAASAEADPFELEQQVSSATLRSQPLSDVPASVTVITRSDLDDFGFGTLADALSSVRGFFISSDHNYLFAGMRGFGPLGDWGSRVLVMIDGHPLVGTVYQDSPLGRDFPVDMGAVERIEIVRGPGSTLYGTNAVFGIVNVVTLRGKDARPGATFTAATSRRASGTLQSGGDASDGWSWLVHGSGFGGRGPDLYFRAYDQPPDSDGWSRGADGERGGCVSASLDRGGWSIRAATGRRTKEVPTGAYGTRFGNGRTNTEDAWSIVSLERLQLVGSRAALQGRLSFVRDSYQGDWLYDGESPDETSMLLDNAEGRKVRADVRALLDANPWLRFTLGGEAERSYRAFQESWYLGDVIQSTNHPYTHWAGYGQAEAQVSTTLCVHAGIRGEYDSHFEIAGNPRAGLVWHASPRVTLKALAGRAFRAPNLYEQYYTDNTTSLPNLDLVPETSWSYESSMEIRAGHGVVLSGTGFRNEIEDWIGIVEVSDGITRYENLGELGVTGTEWEVSGPGPSGLRWRAAYTYARPDDVDSIEQDPANFARHVGHVAIVRPIAAMRGSIALLARAIGDRNNYAGNRVDGYGVADVTWTATPWASVSFTVSVRNVLDADVEDPAGTEHEADAMPQDGRELRAGIGIRL